MDSVIRAKGITLAIVAQKSHSALPTLYNNRSRKRYPKIQEIIAIAKVLDVSLDWLLLGKPANSDYTITENKTVQAYLSAPKAVQDIIDRILRGQP